MNEFRHSTSVTADGRKDPSASPAAPLAPDVVAAPAAPDRVPPAGPSADASSPRAAPALQAARLDFAPDGTPRSRDYDDVYASAAGAAGQARHVFLAGNGLPARWQGRERFTIVETGFGLGGNFLATLAAWRADPARCARLWFVSFEAHPVTADELRRVHRVGREDATATAEADTTMPRAAGAARIADADALANQWPLALPGLHRLEFAGGAVQLLLAFGDAVALAPRLAVAADAFYLDGFAPDRNPRMWSVELFRALGRLAAPDASAATWSVARAVRDALAAAGFDARRAPGFGGKREMTVASLAPRPGRTARRAATTGASTSTAQLDRPAAPATADAAPAPRHDPVRRPPATALVIGAGLAGCAVAARLAARGVAVTLVDAGDAPANLTSGNPAGALQPLVARDDSRQARFTRAGYLDALRHLQTLAASGIDVGGERAGLLHLAADDAEEAAMRGALDALGFPPGHVRWLDRDAAAELARGPVRGGLPLPAGAGAMAGGYLFPEGGWLSPARYAVGLMALADPTGERITPRFGRRVAVLARAGRAAHDAATDAARADDDHASGAGWIALDADGREIARAEIAVLAGGATPVLGAEPPDTPTKDAATFAGTAGNGNGNAHTGTSADAQAALTPLTLRAPAALDWPIRPIAGQLNLLPAWRAAAPSIPVTGDGYVLPAFGAGVLVGASYELDPARVAAVARDGELTRAAEDENLARHARLLDIAEINVGAALPGRSGVRAVPSDRMPLVGAVGLPLPADAPDHALADWPRLPGLYASTGLASRGITWAGLAGEIVAALACGDPAPVETDLLDAVDPARFAQRRRRRGR
ncbi:tRNA (5-methylaminomethyl-2-thiouridine)(34)-methyltransferase MnmD [Derxia gummosa]|uniref:tRNA 5-methylaminomethyl-2-thiouridine biosynthesis bifunctional protein MnmC n=1 Tax=Derxia gummosa DSM 723 TaxID=1121388 RepID=A0A8B6XA84_9BURK|nr:tRNA (5-methylaminomethyl-2-thiouridine)(34)-methyltransferase MnmD [Derxia gummosa]